ncbi:MAG: A24 family peptidase [Noviherbaspirillum sp.]
MNATIALGVLFALLLGAVWFDVRSFRIPNLLVFSGAASGLILNSVLPEGSGFVSALPGAIGFWKALAGLGLGLAILLPMYMLRAMGAGDVKLMAMVGAFLGPRAILGAIFLTLLIGGVLSLLAALRHGTLRRLITNVRDMLMISAMKVSMHEMPTADAPPVSAGRLPYALAIAAGTLALVGLSHAGYAGFFAIS